MTLTREGTPALDAKFELRCTAAQKQNWVTAAREAREASLADWARQVLDDAAHGIVVIDGVAMTGHVATAEPVAVLDNNPDDPPVPVKVESADDTRIPITPQALAALDRAGERTAPVSPAPSSAPRVADIPPGDVTEIALTEEGGHPGAGDEHPGPHQDGDAPEPPSSPDEGLAGEGDVEMDPLHDGSIAPVDSEVKAPDEGSPPAASPLDVSCTNAGLHWRLTYGEQCHYCKGVAL